jgi:hypothetical protein
MQGFSINRRNDKKLVANAKCKMESPKKAAPEERYVGR